MISQKEYITENQSSNKNLKNIFCCLDEQFSTINQLQDTLWRIKDDFVEEYPKSIFDHLNEIHNNLQLKTISQYYDPKSIPVQNEILFKILNDVKKKKNKIMDLKSKYQIAIQIVNDLDEQLKKQENEENQILKSYEKQLKDQFIQLETEKNTIQNSELHIKESMFQQYTSRVIEIEQRQKELNQQIVNLETKQTQIKQKKIQLQIQFSAINLQEQSLETQIKASNESLEQMKVEQQIAEQQYKQQTLDLMNNLNQLQSQVCFQFPNSNYLIFNSDKPNDLQKNLEQTLKSQNITVSYLKYKTQKSYIVTSTYCFTKELETILLGLNQIALFNKNQQSQINVALIVESTNILIKTHPLVNQIINLLESMKSNLNIAIFDKSQNYQSYQELHISLHKKQIKSSYLKNVTLSSVENFFVKIQEANEKNKQLFKQQIQKESKDQIDQIHEKWKGEFKMKSNSLNQDLINKQIKLKATTDDKIKFQNELNILDTQEKSQADCLRSTQFDLNKFEKEREDVQNKMNRFKDLFIKKMLEERLSCYYQAISITQQQIEALKQMLVKIQQKLDSLTVKKKSYQEQLNFIGQFQEGIQAEIYCLFSIIWTLSGFDDDILSFFVLMEDEPQQFINNDKIYNIQTILKLKKDKAIEISNFISFKVKRHQNSIDLEIKQSQESSKDFNEYFQQINQKIQQANLDHIKNINYYSDIVEFKNAINNHISRITKCLQKQ